MWDHQDLIVTPFPYRATEPYLSVPVKKQNRSPRSRGVCVYLLLMNENTQSLDGEQSAEEEKSPTPHMGMSTNTYMPRYIDTTYSRSIYAKELEGMHAGASPLHPLTTAYDPPVCVSIRRSFYMLSIAWLDPPVLFLHTPTHLYTPIYKDRYICTYTGRPIYACIWMHVHLSPQ